MKAVSIALFAGMIGWAPFQLISTADAVTFKEKVLYSFCSQLSCTDGASPTASLIDVNGTLYGTTGGIGGLRIVNAGCCGTVYSLDPSTDAEKVVHYFCSKSECKDGESPDGELINVNGTLYGTTFLGGTGCQDSSPPGCGTVFSLDQNTSREKVLYSFCSQPNCPDGSYPTSLINVNGMLYGTTETGGTGDNSPCPSCGTAFSLDPSTGAETVLYSFCSRKNCTDGSNPNPGLIDLNGTLYGVTISGGAYGCGNGQACGTVFSLDPSTGTETVLHSFGNGTDGKYPEASLLAVNGMLYGTTYAGGVAGCGSFGCGTVFSIDPNTGAEKVLYAFCSQQNCTDGANPFASLIDVNGTLYGTTYAGGITGCGSFGCGTVFSTDPNTGAEKMLYTFLGGTDGANPNASLIAVNGKFYGTTDAGGAYGFGTVLVLRKKR